MSGPRHHVAVGDRFGLLEVIEIDLRLAPTPRSNRNATIGERAVKVRCTCGDERVIKLTNLISAKTRVYGCKSCSAGRSRKKDIEAVLYQALRNIKNRAEYDPAWEDFDAFQEAVLSEIGPRPEGLALARIDLAKPYQPGNIRWTSIQDARRMRLADK